MFQAIRYIKKETYCFVRLGKFIGVYPGQVAHFLRGVCNLSWVIGLMEFFLHESAHWHIEESERCRKNQMTHTEPLSSEAWVAGSSEPSCTCALPAATFLEDLHSILRACGYILHILWSEWHRPEVIEKHVQS